MTNTIQATLYKRPNGDTEQITVTRILPKDAEYLNDNMIKVSMEDIMGKTAVYFDYGAVLDDDETPDEIIIIGHSGKSCEDVMSEAVALIKIAKESGK